MKKQILVTTTTIGAPLAASSHVEVTPNTAAAGSYADISLRVPTESITATTTKLEVDIPAATPFPSVSYLSVPGWDTELLTGTLPTPVTVDKSQITEALNRVVWSALPGSEIKMNEIRQFTPSVGAFRVLARSYSIRCRPAATDRSSRGPGPARTPITRARFCP